MADPRYKNLGGNETVLIGLALPLQQRKVIRARFPQPDEAVNARHFLAEVA